MYARTAKKMDMKKLKGHIWNILANPTEDKENDKRYVLFIIYLFIKILISMLKFGWKKYLGNI